MSSHRAISPDSSSLMRRPRRLRCPNAPGPQGAANFAQLLVLADAVEINISEGSERFTTEIFEMRTHPLTRALMLGASLAQINALCRFAGAWIDKAGPQTNERRPLAALMQSIVERAEQRRWLQAGPQGQLLLLTPTQDYAIECVGVLIQNGAKLTEEDADLIQRMQNSQLPRLAAACAYYRHIEARRNAAIFCNLLAQDGPLNIIAHFIA